MSICLDYRLEHAEHHVRYCERMLNVELERGGNWQAAEKALDVAERNLQTLNAEMNGTAWVKRALDHA